MANKFFYSALFNRDSRLLLKRYIFTGIVELIVMIAYVISFKLSSFFWGEIGFAEYSLVRRTLALLIPILFLGFDIEIPRRMAYGYEYDQDFDTISYFINGCVIVFITVLILSCVLLSDTLLFGRLFFGDSSYSKLIKPLILIIIGFCLHALCYAYFRGMLKIRYANLIHLNTFAIILILSFFVFNRNLYSTLNAIGSLTILSSVAVLIIILRQKRFWNYFNLQKLKVLLKYGSMRMPGPVAISALLTLPATLTSHFSGILNGGYTAFAISTVGLVSTALAPVNIVFLPSACRMITNGEIKNLKRHVY